MTAPGVALLACVLASFCLWHGWRVAGLRTVVLFLGVALATSWAFEEAGVLTGVVFGRYRYATTLGPTVGSVPAVIPIAWFALAYATSVVLDLVGDRWPLGRLGGRARLLGVALVGAGLMAGWDLALDPVLSGPAYRAWTWGSGLADAGVPLQNSLGWLATAFTIFLLSGAVERIRVRPAGRPTQAVSGALLLADATAASSVRFSVPAGPAIPPSPAVTRNDAARCSGGPGSSASCRTPAVHRDPPSSAVVRRDTGPV